MARMEDNFYYFSKADTVESLKRYFEGREYKHTNFYHYTKLDKLNNIIKEKRFWLSSVKGFNDKCDVEQFKDNEKEYFSLCFSAGVNENLPLWYLYSGLDGKGGRIRMTSKKVQSLIEKGEYELCEKEAVKGDDNNEKIVLHKIETLEKDKTMTVKFRDVLYYRTDGDKLSLKYNTMTNYNFNSKNIEEITEYWRHFSKKLIWFYEKETRLLVHVIGDLREEIINSGKDYVVTLNINKDVFNSLSIDFAPEITDINEVLHENESISDFRKIRSNVNLSAYSGDISMDICKNCIKNKQ